MGGIRTAQPSTTNEFISASFIRFVEELPEYFLKVKSVGGQAAMLFG